MIYSDIMIYSDSTDDNDNKTNQDFGGFDPNILNLKRWNSLVHWGIPRNLDSYILS